MAKYDKLRQLVTKILTTVSLDELQFSVFDTYGSFWNLKIQATLTEDVVKLIFGK